jgi:hypothetical protein
MAKGYVSARASAYHVRECKGATVASSLRNSLRARWRGQDAAGAGIFSVASIHSAKKPSSEKKGLSMTNGARSNSHKPSLQLLK